MNNKAKKIYSEVLCKFTMHPSNEKDSHQKGDNDSRNLPAPRGKKSFPTTLSNTEDLPELYNQ